MAVDILGIQILGFLFGMLMLYLTFLNHKRREIDIREFSFWTILWLIFIIVTFVPEILEPVVGALQLPRTMDFFIIIGFMFFAGMIFYTHIIVRKSQRKLEEVVRRIAFQNVRESRSKKIR